MALYQPSNVYPSSLGGIGNGVVDVNDDVNVTWQVNGLSQLTAFQIGIYKNNAESTPIFNTGVIGSEQVSGETTPLPFYGTDRKGNPVPYSYRPGVSWAALTAESASPMVNGGNYKLKILQFYGENPGFTFNLSGANSFQRGFDYYISVVNYPSLGYNWLIFNASILSSVLLSRKFSFDGIGTVYLYSTDGSITTCPAYLSNTTSGVFISPSTSTQESISLCVDQYSESAFLTRESPSLTVSMNGTEINTSAGNANVCEKATASFAATYSQAQNDAINYVRWILVSVNSWETLEDTGEINTSVLSYEFTGLLSGNEYAIRCMVETASGQTADTGYIFFNVEYTTAVSDIENLAVSCQKDGSVLLEWASSTSIPGTASGSYQLQNGSITLPKGSSVLWNSITQSGQTEAVPLNLEPPYSFQIKLKLNQIFTEIYRLSSIDGMNQTSTLNGIVFHPNGTEAVAFDDTGAYILTYSNGRFIGTPVKLCDGIVKTATYISNGDYLVVGGASIDTRNWGTTNIAMYETGATYTEYEYFDFVSIRSDSSSDIVYSVSADGDDFAVASSLYVDSKAYGKAYFYKRNSPFFDEIELYSKVNDIPKKIVLKQGIVLLVIETGCRVIRVTGVYTEDLFHVTLAGNLYADADLIFNNSNPIAIVSEYPVNGKSLLHICTQTDAESYTYNFIIRGVKVIGNEILISGSNSNAISTGFINVFSLQEGNVTLPLFLRGTRNLPYSYSVFCVSQIGSTSEYCGCYMNEVNGYRNLIAIFEKENSDAHFFSINNSSLYLVSPDGVHISVYNGSGTLLGTMFVQGTSDAESNPEYALVMYNSISKKFQTYSLSQSGAVLSQGLLSGFVASGYNAPPISNISINGSVTEDWIYIESAATGDLPEYEYQEPSWNPNTLFFADFMDLEGGNAKESSFSNAIYRYTNGETTMKPIYFAPLSVSRMKDFGVRARTVTDYTLYFMASDDTFYQSFQADSPISVCYPFISLIEATGDENDPTVYHVRKIWRFSSNVSPLSMSNNNTPGWLENFTPYRLRQPSSRMGKTGTLTGLLGNVVSASNKGSWSATTTYSYLNIVEHNGIRFYALRDSTGIEPNVSRGWNFYWSENPISSIRYNDTEKQMEELYAASEGNKTFFLKDKKGGLYMVSISNPITQTVQNNSAEQQVSVSIPWEEIGDANEISLIQLPTDPGWED